ncbi:MAG: hypothetical protein AAGG08_18035 [Actinomycetota bacterium]
MTEPDHDAARLARIEAVLPGRWDRDALRAGASVCLVLAVPFRVIAALVGGDSGGLNALFFVLFLAFFVIGAGCAAWVQRAGTPMSHALVTALGSYVVSEVAFTVVRLVRGTEIPWGSIPLVASMVSLCGVIGGFLGNRLQIAGMRPSTQR